MSKDVYKNGRGSASRLIQMLTYDITYEEGR